MPNLLQRAWAHLTKKKAVNNESEKIIESYSNESFVEKTSTEKINDVSTESLNSVKSESVSNVEETSNDISAKKIKAKFKETIVNGPTEEITISEQKPKKARKPRKKKVKPSEDK